MSFKRGFLFSPFLAYFPFNVLFNRRGTPGSCNADGASVFSVSVSCPFVDTPLVLGYRASLHCIILVRASLVPFLVALERDCGVADGGPAAKWSCCTREICYQVLL